MADASEATPVSDSQDGVLYYLGHDRVLLAILVLGIGLAVSSFAGVDVRAGWIGIIVVPAIAWLAARLAEHFRHSLESAKIQQQGQNELVQIQKKSALDLANAMQRQQREFEASLMLGQRSQLVDEVLALLHRCAFADPDDLKREQRSERVREISEIAYRTLIYFQDEKLIEWIISAFEGAFRGRRRSLVQDVNYIADRFRLRLHDMQTREPGAAASVSFTDMEKHLNRLNKAIIGLEPCAGVVPIKIKGTASRSSWMDIRFGHQISDAQLGSVMDVRVPKRFVASIATGDLLVFWINPRNEMNDGVVGVAWVDAVEESKDSRVFTLGRRATVAREDVVRFSRLRTDGLLASAHNGDEPDESATRDASDESADASDEGADASDSGDVLRDLLERGDRIEPGELSYPFGFTLGTMIDRLESRRPDIDSLAALPPLRARLSNVKGAAIQLRIDFDEFAQRGSGAERLLEEMAERVCDGGLPLEIEYRGTQWVISHFNPRHVLKHDPFAASPSTQPHDIGRSFAAINLTPVVEQDGLGTPPRGWSPFAKVRVTVDSNRLCLRVEETQEGADA